MTTLKIGDKAPNFESVDEKGNVIKLSDYKGKKLVLFFYPKASTPGCTNEACNLRDNYNDLLKTGFDVVGVSADDEKKHLKFIDKHDLPFHLLADVDKKVINDYGVWGPKKFMGKVYDGIHRTTFIINESGMIEKVIKKCNQKKNCCKN